MSFFGGSDVSIGGGDGSLGKVKKIGLKLGGGFKYVLFSPLFGEDSHSD